VEFYLHLFLNVGLDGCEWSDCLHCHFTAREKAGVGGWVGAGAGLDVLERR